MSILLSLFLYLAVFMFSAICIYVGKSIRIRSITIAGILAVILLGFLRYGIGADYGNYLMSYQYYATGETFGLGVNNHNFNLEPFFQLVAKVSYELTNSPILFFGITWGLMVLLIFFGIKKLLPSVDSKNFSGLAIKHFVDYAFRI